MTTTRQPRPAAIIVLIALVLGCGILIGHHTRADQPAAPAATQTATAGPVQTPPTPAMPSPSTVPEPTQEANPPDPDGTELPTRNPEDARAWEAVAAGFGRNFVRPAGDQATWVRRLTPYTTVAVQQQLQGVDRTRIPAGTYDGVETIDDNGEQVVVRVDYQPGWSLAVSLITDGHHWHVYQYDRYEQ